MYFTFVVVVSLVKGEGLNAASRLDINLFAYLLGGNGSNRKDRSFDCLTGGKLLLGPSLTSCQQEMQ